jgi:ATP-binding cassette, subfamily B, heavy metal transporter
MPRGMGMGGGGGRPWSGAGGGRGGEPPVMPVTGFEGRALKALIPYLWPPGQLELRIRVVAVVVLLLAAKFVAVYVPLAYKYAVDALTELARQGPEAVALGIVAVPVTLIVAYGALRVGAMLMAEMRDLIFAKVAQRSMRRIALQAFRHLHELSLRFHMDRQTGGLSRAIERGTNGIDQLLRIMLFNIMPTIVELALVIGILWGMYSGWFSAVVVTMIVTYVGFTIAMTEWRRQFRREMNRTESEASTRAVDSLLNYETVKYFGNEEHQAERYDDALRRYEYAAIKSKTTLSLLNIGQGILIAVGLTTMMVMAGYGVAEGTMTVGDFVAVNAYLIQLSIPLNWLGVVYREVIQSLIDMESMFALLEVKQEVPDKPGAPAIAVRAGAVRFENVHFGYDPRRPILKGVSFEVPAGSTVAIVGPTGAGKSTISRLLFRFYDIDEGRITIDGQSIQDVTQASLRAAIGIVPQDTVLFNDSIHYNINFGRPEASNDEVDEAARLAQIRDFVRALPDGYDTVVGERGLKLSGGEKQRVAIARTVLKRPRIFLFDEATSSLDTHTEKEIQRSLKEVSANRTTLVIAHRLSTVVDADQIIVLDDGKVVERGRHADLLGQDGRYAAMWRRQLETSAKAQLALDSQRATAPAAAE